MSDVADVEEVRGAQVGRQVLLFNLEANDIGVVVTALDVVDRDREALGLGMCLCDGGQQVGRESGDAALARQVVADKGDLPDLGRLFHEFTSVNLRPLIAMHNSRFALTILDGRVPA